MIRSLCFTLLAALWMACGGSTRGGSCTKTADCAAGLRCANQKCEADAAQFVLQASLATNAAPAATGAFQIDVAILRSAGFTEEVEITLANPPAGFSATATKTRNNSARLTVDTVDAACGAFELSVAGTGAGATTATVVAGSVNLPNDFAVGLDDNAPIVSVGDTLALHVSLTASKCTSQTPTLTVSGMAETFTTTTVDATHFTLTTLIAPSHALGVINAEVQATADLVSHATPATIAIVKVVHGTVVDLYGHHAGPGVTVHVPNTSATTDTDATGAFSLSVPTLTYTLMVSRAADPVVTPVVYKGMTALNPTLQHFDVAKEGDPPDATTTYVDGDVDSSQFSGSATGRVVGPTGKWLMMAFSSPDSIGGWYMSNMLVDSDTGTAGNQQTWFRNGNLTLPITATEPAHPQLDIDWLDHTCTTGTMHFLLGTFALDATSFEPTAYSYYEEVPATLCNGIISNSAVIDEPVIANSTFSSVIDIPPAYSHQANRVYLHLAPHTDFIVANWLNVSAASSLTISRPQLSAPKSFTVVGTAGDGTSQSVAWRTALPLDGIAVPVTVPLAPVPLMPSGGTPLPETGTTHGNEVDFSWTPMSNAVHVVSYFVTGTGAFKCHLVTTGNAVKGLSADACGPPVYEGAAVPMSWKVTGYAPYATIDTAVANATGFTTDANLHFAFAGPVSDGAVGLGAARTFSN